MNEKTDSLSLSDSEFIFLCFLIVIQISAFISNIIIIKMFKQILKNSFLYDVRKRPIVLMTSISYSAIILFLSLDIPVFIIEPILANNNDTIYLLITNGINNYLINVSLYVISLSMICLSFD